MYLSSSFLLLPLLLTATATTVAASSLTVVVPPSNLLPNPHALPAGTHATLTTLPSSSAQTDILSAPLTRSSTFVFRDLDASRPGGESYLLDIRSRDYVFAPFRVDIAADGTVLGIWETFRGNPWENRGVEKFVATSSGGQLREDVTVEAKVVARRGFYEERPRFSPLSLFKNPMILLAVFALAVTFGIPKLMENMDPEMRAEFEKQSRSSPLSNAGRNALTGGPGPGANFDLAGWMAGATSEPTASSDSVSRGAARRRG
ncbi:hypothetical protein VTN02DRAFT_199 [Thermoascus thermophilus]